MLAYLVFYYTIYTMSMFIYYFNGNLQQSAVLSGAKEKKIC